ncbi:uncharacterized protein LOC126836626 [Adelges cooleyi]|uniref:uncharacterized protein LOC126836626 n=1 Tax=Adelges cooleyi TaxID=133065 RepID=UPI00217FC4C0|nr:uncharacterized protein LOC126836626 [Adelges cooleyi]XP_050426150.1 uncharacterized protein LOC126836626 [Adelges cooleyi]
MISAGGDDGEDDDVASKEQNEYLFGTDSSTDEIKRFKELGKRLEKYRIRHQQSASRSGTPLPRCTSSLSTTSMDSLYPLDADVSSSRSVILRQCLEDDRIMLDESGVTRYIGQLEEPLQLSLDAYDGQQSRSQLRSRLNSTASIQNYDEIIDKRLQEKTNEELKKQIQELRVKLQEYEVNMEKKDKLLVLKKTAVDNSIMMEKNKTHLQSIKALEQRRADDYTEYCNNLDEIQKTCKYLESKNLHLQKENSVLHAEKMNLREDYDKLSIAHDELVASVRNQAAKESSEADKIEKLMFQYNQLKQENTQCSKAMKVLQHDNEVLQGELEKANANNELIAAKVNDLTAIACEAESFKVENCGLKEEIEKLRQEETSLRDNLEKLSDTKLEQTIDGEGQEKLIEDNRILHQKINEFQTETERLLGENDSLNKQLQSQLGLVQEMENRWTQLKEAYLKDKDRATLMENVIEELQNSNSQLNSANMELTNELEMTKANLTDTKDTRVQSVSEENNRLRTHLSYLEVTIEDLQTKNDELKSTNIALNEQIENLVTLKMENSQLEERIDELISVVNKYEAQINQMNDVIGQLKSSQTDASALDSLKKQNDEKITELKSYVGQLTNQLEVVMREKNLYANECSALTSRLEENNAAFTMTVEGLQKQLDSVSKENKFLINERPSLVTRIGENETSISNLNSVIDELKNRVTALTKENNAYVAEERPTLINGLGEKEQQLTNLNATVERLKDRLKTIMKENDKFVTKERPALEARINENDIRLSQSNELLKHFQEKAAQLDIDLNALRNENSELAEKLKRLPNDENLEQQYKLLTDRFQKQKHLLVAKAKALKECEATCRGLEQQVQTLKEELENRNTTVPQQNINSERIGPVLSQCDQDLQECHKLINTLVNDSKSFRDQQSHQMCALKNVFQNLSLLFEQPYDVADLRQVIGQIFAQNAINDDELENYLQTTFTNAVNILETSNDNRNASASLPEVKLIAQTEVDKLIFEAVENVKSTMQKKSIELKQEQLQRLNDQNVKLKAENEILKQQQSEAECNKKRETTQSQLWKQKLYNNCINTNDSCTQTLTNQEVKGEPSVLRAEYKEVNAKHNSSVVTEGGESELKSLQRRYNSLKAKYKQLRIQQAPVSDRENNIDETFNLERKITTLVDDLKRERERYDRLKQRFVRESETHAEDMSHCQNELENLMYEKLELSRRLAAVEEKYQILQNDYDQLKSCNLDNFSNLPSEVNNKPSSIDCDNDDEPAVQGDTQQLFHDEPPTISNAAPLSLPVPVTNTLESNVNASEENQDLQQRSIAERDRLIEFLTEKIQKLEWDYCNRNANNVENSIVQVRDQLDRALAAVHERDVRCDELTLELTRLLEERDTLQLRLSNAIRQIQQVCEDQKNCPQQQPQNIMDDKIEELRGLQYKKDYGLYTDQERRHVSQMQLHSRDSNPAAVPKDTSSPQSLPSTAEHNSSGSSSQSWFKDILW